MKKTIFILLNYLFVGITASSQNYKISYRLTFQEAEEKVEQEDFYLYTSSEQSTFVSDLKIRKDSIIKDKETDIGSKMKAYKAIPQTKFDFFLQKKYETNTVLFAQKVGKYIGYQKIVPSYDWQVVDSVKKNNGFSCRKGILKLNDQTYNAWFTDEISVFDGPYFFQGLPGLILEVSCIERNYQFTFVGIEKGYSPVIYPDKSFEAITDNRDKFIQVVADWEKNTVKNLFKSGNVSMGNPDDSVQKYIKQFQSELDEKKPKFKLEIF
jgi:GLPGLI family protein